MVAGGIHENALAVVAFVDWPDETNLAIVEISGNRWRGLLIKHELKGGSNIGAIMVSNGEVNVW